MRTRNCGHAPGPPPVFAGFKIAAPSAVLGTITAAWAGAELGLGALMLYALDAFDINKVWLAVLLACALSAAAYAFWAGAKRLLIYWDSTKLMHVYGASRWQQIRMLRAPFSLPYFFTGLRIAGANAILGAMLAEWLTGSRGLGFLILESSELREIELPRAAILTSVSVALLVFAATSAAERSVLHWREA